MSEALLQVGAAKTNALPCRPPGAAQESGGAVPELKGLWDAQRLEHIPASLLAPTRPCSPAGDVLGRVGSWEDDAAGGSAVVRVGGCCKATAPTALSRPFERRLRGTAASGRAGRGEGLAAARQVAEQHRGAREVSCVSETAAVPTVRLPLRSDR